MRNMNDILRQAQVMQSKLSKLQQEMAERSYEAASGGGMVTAVARGDQSIARIRIDPKVVDPQDVEMLEDLVTAAVAGALQAARELASKEMSALTAGLPLPPGMKLPF